MELTLEDIALIEVGSKNNLQEKSQILLLIKKEVADI